MPFQVKSGSFTVVAPSADRALELFDRFVGEGSEEVSIHDMDGVRIDLEAVRRALLSDE